MIPHAFPLDDHQRRNMRGMAAAIRVFPWEETTLGVSASWPVMLQSATTIMLDSVCAMAIAWGPDSTLLYNDAYAEILQDKHPRALGLPVSHVFPEAWPQVQLLFARVGAGDPIAVEDVRIPLHRNGILVDAFFTFSYTPLHDDAGTNAGVLAVVLETTTRNTKEAEFSNIFEATLSATADFACVFDREGRFTYANRPYTELMGFTREALHGKCYAELGLPPALSDKLTRQLAEAFATRKAVRDETYFVSAGGRKGFFDYIFNPAIKADGTVSAVVCTTRDITELKNVRNGFEAARDAAEAANHAKDDFLAALSHELRTPLNPILLLASEASHNDALSEAVRHDFSLISQNAELEARLIDDLLDLTKITRGKMSLAMGRVDLHTVLRDALANVAGDFRLKELELIEQLHAGRSVVTGDPIRLQQVFWNILRNAAKFTPAKGQVRVETHTRGQRIVVTVADTGMGMTKSELARLFNAFVQGDHGSGGGSHRFGGLGLGLAISRMLIELHSGTITATSQGVRQGSTFSVSLPLMGRTDAADPKRDTVIPVSESPVITSRLKILLVEDHEPTRVALRQLLRARHHDVVEAASVECAVALAASQPFDLMLTDIGLPDGDGYALISSLKKPHGFLTIVLSGYGMEEDVNRSLAAGAVAHLTKPVRIQSLDAALSAAVNASSVRGLGPLSS